MEPEDLRRRLAEQVGRHESMLVAFSGGVDSTLLAVVAHQVLGGRMLAVLADSAVHPPGEAKAARELAAQLGLPLLEVRADDLLALPAFEENAEDRCYHCKRQIFGLFAEIAASDGFAVVADGTNVDDLGDYRPGRQACEELGIVSPLADAGLTKADVRVLARFVCLPNAEKPSMACLASRFPYGERIDAPALARVAEAEAAVRRLGLHQFRVRAHGPVARVEVAPDELDEAGGLRNRIVSGVKAAGFAYVALDLEGYRTGAMNEVLGGQD